MRGIIGRLNRNATICRAAQQDGVGLGLRSMPRSEGWRVNHKRVERIWWECGLKVPEKQPKRGRPWLNDGSCVRLRPESKDHV